MSMTLWTKKTVRYASIFHDAMHYPMLELKRSHHGSIQLHGHIHSKGMTYNLDCKKNGIRRYDVGVDANGYFPVALTTILDFINMP